MITLNILPPQKKREYELIRVYRFLLSAFEALLFVTCSAAILLVLARMSLRNRVERIFQPTLVLERSTGAFTTQIESLNTLLRTLDGVQDQSLPWSPFIHDLIARTPSTIHLTTVQQTNVQTLEIQGRAATRNDLLEFKNRLAESPWLTNLEFPVTNLIARERVPFEIRATIQSPTTTR